MNGKSIYVPINLRIFSTNYIIIVKKYFMRPNKKYMYLEPTRRDLQNGVKILVKFFS